ncbi:deoxyribodipyrimidine photo-lyase, partial [bacterium]|nr:deoxyribodipyrimidine photo-lyase [bacterium]
MPETLEDRVHKLNDRSQGKGTVVYWMSRDQRVSDNWALLYAQQKAIEAKEPLLVVFCLVPDFLDATMRHYGFMLRGLKETSTDLTRKNIGFKLLEGDPVLEIPRLVESSGAGLLVTDFDPLRIKTRWRTSI